MKITTAFLLCTVIHTANAQTFIGIEGGVLSSSPIVASYIGYHIPHFSLQGEIRDEININRPAYFGFSGGYSLDFEHWTLSLMPAIFYRYQSSDENLKINGSYENRTMEGCFIVTQFESGLYFKAGYLEEPQLIAGFNFFISKPKNKFKDETINIIH